MHQPVNRMAQTNQQVHPQVQPHPQEQPNVHAQVHHPVYREIHQPNGNKVYQLIQQEAVSSPDVPFQKSDSPRVQKKESPRKEIDLQNIESFKNDPSTEPVSYIDHDKKVEPNQKPAQEVDIPYQAGVHDEPLYRLVSKETFEKKPQQDVMEESVVDQVEISKELPKNNGFPDDKPFESEAQFHNHDKNYFENIKRNYDQHYQFKYINPHLDGHQMVHPDSLHQLQRLNEKNKKLNSEYISQQMKIGSNEEPKPLTKIKLESESQVNPENQKLSNIEGLTPQAERNLQFMTGDQIHQNILNRDEGSMKKFVQPDEPFHHDIGVTLNQINTFASKNTRILEGQNESIVPVTDQSELMTPVKAHVTQTVPARPVANLFNPSNRSSEQSKQSFEPVSIQSQNSQRPNPDSVGLIKPQRISHPVQNKPIEVISFKKQGRPNVDDMNTNVFESPMRVTSSPIYNKVFKKIESTPKAVEVTRWNEPVRNDMKVSYVTEQAPSRPSELAGPQAQVQFSSQPKAPSQNSITARTKTPKSSKIIGKYEVLIDPATKKKRIVISSKPIKFSHRANPRSTREILKSSQQNVTGISYISSTKESSLTSTPYKKVPNENYTVQRAQPSQVYARPSASKQVKTVSVNSIKDDSSSTPKVTRISITSKGTPRYTANQPWTQSSQQRTTVTPRDAYHFDAPKIVRVSHNVTTKPMRVSQTTGHSKISTYSNTESHKPYIRTLPVHSTLPKRTMTNVIRPQPSGPKEVYKSTINPTRSRVSSTLRETYNNAHRVNAYSSKSGAVNYVSKRPGQNTVTQPRVIRASQNVPKNSVRYEKLQTRTYAKRKHPVITRRTIPFDECAKRRHC